MPNLEEYIQDLDFYKSLKKAIEDALLQGSTQLEVSIAGRTVRYRSLEELIAAKQYVETEIDRVERAIRLLQGENVPSRKIRVRFKNGAF